MAKKVPVHRCIVCRREAADVKVLRFSLIRSTKRPDGRATTRGCGAIDLCQICWTNAKRMTGTLRIR